MPALVRKEPSHGSGTFMEPRSIEAEVLYTDREPRPVKVLSWHRLDVARRQPLTGVWVFWLVQLQLPGGEEGWFEYDSSSLRPLKTSSSSASETESFSDATER
jgi:hypothetical protein